MGLSIMGIEIRQDLDGLYSLNDVHRASGALISKKPSEWLSNEQPSSIARKLEAKAGIPALNVYRGGRSPGTYACKELVIMYSSWLDDDFHVDVLQSFDFLLQGDLQGALDTALRNALRMGYPGLQTTLKETRAEQGKDTLTHHHKNEADLLNRVVLGMSSKQYKLTHGMEEDADLRDHLTTKQKEQLAYLQQVDTSLIAVGDTYDERKAKLIALFNRRYC
jgi:hypothetical protein